MTLRGPVDQAVLLEQVSWIRRLARELVADRELAEDLVQETCVVALEQAPRETTKLRAWLAEVLRNLLRQHARGQGRRSAREAWVARPEALEPTDELVERVLLQRELVNAVLALSEPYRSTVLLRFFEELPPREIAQRTGVPLATVQSRLQRALAQLRERLDADRPAWAGLLLSWARGVEPFGPPTLLSVLMKTQLAVVAGVAALAATAFVWWSASSEGVRERAPEAVPSAALTPPLQPFDSGGMGAAAPPSEREALAASAPRAGSASGSAAPRVEAASWPVRLRVLDAEAQPMSGVAVRAEGDESVLGTSGLGGWCVFQTRAETLTLVAADPRWVTVHEGSPARASSVDPVLVLAPALELAGVVRDEFGRPLVAAGVRCSLPEGFRTRFTEVLEASRTLGWRTTTDATGAFRFARVPAVAGAQLTAVSSGYERGVLESPLVDAHDLEFVLTRPRLPLAGTLRGRVLDSAGAPVADARVGLGLASVVSDERGSFELELARAVTTETLVALKAGFLPARLERPDEPGANSTGWPAEVTLVLPGPALTIRGVVLDHEGQPVAGARLWPHDPTPSAPIGQMPTFFEPQMAGAKVPAAALESVSNLPAADGDNFSDSYTSNQEPSALWNWVASDVSGRFELPGLDQRRYRLDVSAAQSLEIFTSDALAAGDGQAVIRLPAPELYERVEGRILAEDGKPLADVQVRLWRPLVDVRARVFGGQSQVVILQQGAQVTSDAEGRFHFERVPKQGAQLSVRGDSIVPLSLAVTGPSLEIPVDVRCHLEVVLRALGKFDSIQVADGEGQRLDLLELTEGSVSAWTSVDLIDGKSGVVSVSSRARELRLFKGKTLVETRPLDLVPGDVNRIEL